jgi:CheY-like chemotaxis protein
MSETRLKFLIIDGNVDSRYLLARTLKRKFPSALILECQTRDTAVALLSDEKPDAVIAHRTDEVDGVTIIQTLRNLNATIPIIMVSGIDRQEAAKSAGANSFLHYDEWLRIGSVLDELLKAGSSKSAANSERQR